MGLPALLLGPLGEELGWRAYPLPRLLQRMRPLTAALVVGIIWMVWHIPAFLASGPPQSGMALPVFAIAGVALSLFVTWLFLNANQSILVAGILPCRRHRPAQARAPVLGEDRHDDQNTPTAQMTWMERRVTASTAGVRDPSVHLPGLRR